MSHASDIQVSFDFDRKSADTRPMERRFLDFHEANPQVMELFASYARKMRARGFARYGAGMIMEIVRWHHNLEHGPGESGEGFKINNNYTAYYARKLMKDDPSFAGFFETRKLASER